jgi:parvulin-like peptidyl-prolyl isomerase
MKRSLLMLVAIVAALGAIAAGCGGSQDVPANAVAVVDGTEISSTQLDALMEQAKASYKAGKRDFPKVGTPEYQSLQQQYVAFLVQKTQFEQAAADMGIEVTDADVDKARNDLKKDRFDGNEKKLQDALEENGLSEDAFRETLRVSLLSDKLFKEVTKGVKVTDAEALQAFTQSPEQFGGKPESREVRHILISEKDKNGQVDYTKSKAKADDVYSQLKNGADFAALAKKYSEDPGSKDTGGKYLANRGQSVPEFDKAAFDLKTNEISKPVKTQFGYHIIEPLADSKPATSFEDVRAAVKAALLQQKRTEEMTKWVTDLRDKYEGKVSYASGYEPPELPDTTETATQ